MKKLFALLFLLAGFAQAQTTVTATVVDPNGNPYANGTAAAYSVVATGQPFKTITPVATTNLGSFSLSLTAGTYVFTVCSTSVLQGQQSPNPPPIPANGVPSTNPAPKQICFASGPIAISGVSQDISTQLNGVAALLGPRLGAGGGGGGGAQPFLQRTNSPNCTTINQLVTYDTVHLDANGFATVQNASVSSKGVIGTVIAGAGCSGIATIGTYLSAPVVMDGAATVGDVVSPSASVAGFASDELSTAAQPGVQTVGRVAKANTGGSGTLAQVDFFLGDLLAPGSTSSGNAFITPCTTNGCMIYEPTANQPNITGDNSTVTNGAGAVTMKSLGLTDAAHAGNWFETQGPQPLPAPVNSTMFYVGTSITTPNSFQLPKAAGAADVNKAWGVTSNTTDANGNPIDIMGLITSGGTTLPGAGTLLNPSIPTAVVNGTPASTDYKYAVVGCEDSACVFHSAISSIVDVPTGAATITSTNSITLSAYGDTLYGYRGYIVCRTSSSGTPATTGVITNGLIAGKKFIDTGLTADGSNCASVYASNNTFTWDGCMGASLPGNPSVPGAPCGVDGPPLIPKAIDNEHNNTFGVPGDVNDGVYSWGGGGTSACTQGAATAVWSNGTLILTTDTTTQVNCLVSSFALPSTPFTVMVNLSHDSSVAGATNEDCFIGLRESSTGKMTTFGITNNQQATTIAADGGYIWITKNWTTNTAFTNHKYQAYSGQNGYFKIQDTGSALNYLYSDVGNGVGFFTFDTQTLTNAFTTAPNQLFVGGAGIGGTAAVCTFDFERETQ